MKHKLIFLFIFSFITNCAFADTTITIPVDFLNKVVKKVEKETGVNVIHKFLISQIIKNTKIDGIKLEKYTTEALIDYFNNDKVFKQIASNKLLEPNTGATLEFDSDGKCNKSQCTIKLDLNGDLPPNEIWEESFNPKDQVILVIEKDGNGGVNLIFPEYAK